MITVQTYDVEAQQLVEVTFWDAQEVADMLKVHPSTVRKLARAGLAHPYPGGGVQHFRGSDIARFYAALSGEEVALPEGDPLDVDPAQGTPVLASVEDQDLEGLR